MMVVTMKFLLVLNVLAVFTEAFHASHRGWIKRPAAAPRGGRVLKAGEDEYGDLMSKLESSMDSVGTAVKTQVVVPPTSLDSPAPVSLPKVELPSPSAVMETPQVELPKVEIELPKVEIPTLDSLELPSVEIPKVELSIPEMSIPSVELPSVGDLDLGSVLGGGDVFPIAVGGLVLLAALAALSGGGNGKDSTPSSTSSSSSSASAASSNEMFFATNEVDLSIPYDAAARLAYEKAGKPGDYAAFKKKYEEDAVAMVKSKQKSRQKA